MPPSLDKRGYVTSCFIQSMAHHRVAERCLASICSLLRTTNPDSVLVMNLHRWKGNLKHTSQALKYFLGDDGELVDTALKRAGRGATPCLHCAGESSQNHDRHHCTGPPATHFYRQLARYRSAILRGLGRRYQRTPAGPTTTNKLPTPSPPSLQCTQRSYRHRGPAELGSPS